MNRREMLFATVAAGSALLLIAPKARADDPDGSQDPGPNKPWVPSHVGRTPDISTAGFQQLADISNSPRPTAESPDSQIVAAATSPLDPFDFEEKKLLDQIKRAIGQYGMSDTSGNIRKLTDGLADCGKRIDYEFANTYDGFSADVAGGRKFVFTSDGTLNPFQFESLLDQAADLLDRALRLRTERDDLAVKAYEVGASLVEFAENDKILMQEVIDGLYASDYIQAHGEHQATVLSEKLAKRGSGFLQYLIANRYTVSALVNIAHYAGHAALCAAYPEFLHIESSKGDEGVGKEFPYRFGIENSIWTTGATYRIHERQEACASFASEHTLVTQSASLRVQYEAQLDTADISGARRVSTEEKRIWAAREATHKRNRAMVSRRLNYLKALAATNVGGVLNYIERMEPLALRFNHDLFEAIARIRVAQQGLSQVYGYSVPLPDEIRALEDGNLRTTILAGSRQYLDRLLLWVRDAISWVVAFGQRDNEYVYPVSIKLFGEHAWSEGLQSGVWRFVVGEDMFPSQRCVRLRGLSCFVVGPTAGTWKGILSPPKVSQCRLLNGQLSQLDQAGAKAVRSSRISTRSDPRDPDVVGTAAVRNFSPLGEWTVTFEPRSSEGTTLSQLADITLNLHIVTRPMN